MNTTTNVGLLVAGTALVSLGVSQIAHDLISGSIEVLLGIVIYLVYELTPSK